MTIDAEGLDYDVLISNDWYRFRPKVLVVEDMLIDHWEDIENSRIYKFLTTKNYSLYSKLFRSFIYVDRDFI